MEFLLTDTFQLYENGDGREEQMFSENNERVNRQQKTQFKVIIGNPPYSARQENQNDNNKNLKYSKLDEKINQTYQKMSSAKNSNTII
jgi:predicted helicase